MSRNDIQCYHRHAYSQPWKLSGGLYSFFLCAKSKSNASVIEKAKVLASAYTSDLDDSLNDKQIQLRSFIKPEDDINPKGVL